MRDKRKAKEKDDFLRKEMEKMGKLKGKGKQSLKGKKGEKSQKQTKTTMTSSK